MIRVLLTLIVLFLTGCSSRETTAPSPGADPSRTTPQPSTVASSQAPSKAVPLSWASAGHITNGEFTVRIQTHEVEVAKIRTELSFATLESNGHLVMKFDGVRNPLGNETRVCFAPLLGGSQVLAVEQESNREWQIWIVALKPKVRVLFDNRDWGVGRNLYAEDIDGDGVAELRQESLHYWFFANVSNFNSPFPEVIFQFDKRRERYLPANPKFPRETLEALTESQSKVDNIESPARDPRSKEDLRAAVIAVMIELCYAGREKEAWNYYEKHYTEPDRYKMRRAFQKRLANDPVYRWIAKKAGN